jgi:hypothetical protein
MTAGICWLSARNSGVAAFGELCLRCLPVSGFDATRFLVALLNPVFFCFGMTASFARGDPAADRNIPKSAYTAVFCYEEETAAIPLNQSH